MHYIYPLIIYRCSSCPPVCFTYARYIPFPKTPCTYPIVNCNYVSIKNVILNPSTGVKVTTSSALFGVDGDTKQREGRQRISWDYKKIIQFLRNVRMLIHHVQLCMACKQSSWDNATQDTAQTMGDDGTQSTQRLWSPITLSIKRKKVCLWGNPRCIVYTGVYTCFVSWQCNACSAIDLGLPTKVVVLQYLAKWLHFHKLIIATT